MRFLIVLLIFLVQDCFMKTTLIFLGAVMLGFGLAQNDNGFTVVRTPGVNNQIVTTESLARGANLRMRCVGNQIEVVLDPKIKLNREQTPLVTWQFDGGAGRQQRFSFEPESGLLLLPQMATFAFLDGVARSNQLRMNLPEAINLGWTATFNTTNFREAYTELPCKNSLVGTSVPVTMTPTRVIDPTVAFIAPLEFAKAFGGRFEPENGKLAWEYNGVKLLLERGSTAIQNVFANTSLELPRPIQVLGGRTVAPVRLVNAFNCKIMQTKPTDAMIKITCGAGTTLLERNLPRY
jgi:hypothetical protein